MDYKKKSVVFLLSFCLLTACEIKALPIDPSSPSPSPQPTASPTSKPRVEDTLVGKVSARYQGESSVAMNDKGEYVVAWLRQLDVDKIQIMAQKFSADNVPLGSEIIVNSKVALLIETQKEFASTIKSFQNVPQIAIDQAGNFVVSWGVGKDLFFRQFNNQGQPLREEVKYAEVEEDGEAALTMTPDGGFIIAWRTTNAPVHVQRFDKKGEKVGEPVNPFSTLRNNRLAVNKQGNFVVMSDGQIQRYSADAKPQGAIVKIPISRFYSDIAMDEQNQLVVAYEAVDSGQVNQTTQFSVFAQRYDAQNNPLGAPFKVHQNPFDFADIPQPVVGTSRSGDFVIAWGESGAEQNKGNIFARRFKSDGTPREAEFKINLVQSGFKSKPAMDMNAQGDFVVTWQNWNDNTGEYRVLSRKLNINQALPPELPTLDPEPVDCSKEAALTQEMTETPSQSSNSKVEDTKETIKNKPPYTGPITIKVAGHVIDPKQPDLASALKEHSSTSRLSRININDGQRSMAFETGTIIVEMRKSGCLDELLGLYKATAEGLFAGFQKLNLDLSTSPIQKIEELIRTYNKGTVEDIKTIDFSSLESFQTFAIELDIVANHLHLVKSVELNMAAFPAQVK